MMKLVKFYKQLFPKSLNLSLIFCICSKCKKVHQQKCLFVFADVEWGNLMCINGNDEESGSWELPNYLNYYLYTSHALIMIMYLVVVGLRHHIFLMTVILP